MQRFIDNWSATLLVGATTSDLEITVDPAQAAKLTALGAGDHYQITAALKDDAGTEVAWEVMQVTANAGGVLTVARGAVPLALPVGTQVSARLTAATLDAIRAGGAALLTRDAFVEQILGGALGVIGPVMGFAHADVGAYLLAELDGVGQPVFPWLTTDLHASTAYDGSLAITLDSPGGSAGFAKAGAGDNRINLTTGTASSQGVRASLQAPASITDIATGILECTVWLKALSVTGQTLNVEVTLGLPSFTPVSLRYGVDYNTTYWRVYYTDPEGIEHWVLTSLAATTSAAHLFRVERVGANLVVSTGVGLGKVTLASLPIAGLQRAPSGMGCEIFHYKVTGTTPAILQLGRIQGLATLP